MKNLKKILSYIELLLAISLFILMVIETLKGKAGKNKGTLRTLYYLIIFSLVSGLSENDDEDDSEEMKAI